MRRRLHVTDDDLRALLLDVSSAVQSNARAVIVEGSFGDATLNRRDEKAMIRMVNSRLRAMGSKLTFEITEVR